LTRVVVRLAPTRDRVPTTQSGPSQDAQGRIIPARAYRRLPRWLATIRLVSCVSAASVTLPDKHQGEPKMLRSAIFSSRLLLALGIGMVGALSACQIPPPPAPTTVAHHTEQFVATVVSVDMTTREVVLSTPDGRHATVVAGPEVTNLGRLKPGDRLTFTINDAIAVQMATPGSPPVGTGASGTAANGRSINTAARVTIVSAATDGTSVTFTGANGVTHTIDVLAACRT
jgi:hypothetical protein